jgi:uncharacterized membrane protein
MSGSPTEPETPGQEGGFQGSNAEPASVEAPVTDAPREAAQAAEPAESGDAADGSDGATDAGASAEAFPKHEPLASSEEPVASNDSPITRDGAPVASGEEPAVSSEEPAVSSEEPAAVAPAIVEAPKSVAAGADTDAKERELTSSARCIGIAALLGAAIALWSQFAFQAPWLDDFVRKNESDTDVRHRLLLLFAVGIALGAGAAGAGIAYLKRKQQSIVPLEGWLWFVSPLILLPVVPMLFDPDPWTGRHAVLLTAMVVVLLVFETLVKQSLAHAPPAAKAWWAELGEQVPALVKRRGPIVIVTVAALAYAAFFIFFTLRWHYKLRTGNYDLSINNNLMYGGLHGRFLESTVVFPTDPAKYLANHAKFGAYLFLPIYAIFPRAETLLVIQSLFIGLGAVPLFLFARRHLSEWTATLLALAYLSYYPLHGANFSEFQANPVAAFFVFGLAWALDARRYRLAAVALVIGLSMREDVSVGLAVLGAFFLLSGYRPMAGLVVASVSTAYFLALRFYVMEEAGSWWFPNMYKELWADGEKGFRSVVKTMISNPLFTLEKLTTQKKLEYLLHLLVPLAFLPARRWFLWAAFVPGVLLTLLVTNYDPPISYSFHYVMHWAPYLFMAAVVALKLMATESPATGLIKQRAAFASMIAATLVLTFNYGAFPRREGSFKGGFHRVEFSYTEREYERYKTLLELTKDIAPEDSVAATEKEGPHLSSRLKIYAMRRGPQDAKWIVASSRGLKLSKTKPTLKEAVESGRYGVVRRQMDFALLKRGHDTSQNEKLIRDWGL